VDQFAHEFERWADAICEDRLEPEVRHRLAAAGVPLDDVDAEAERVLPR
jgi:hypothetical protein